MLKTIVDVIDMFKEKFLKAFDEHATEIMAKQEGFKEYYLNSILADTASYTGTELNRRNVGMAQVKDVTTIEDEKKRMFAERVNIFCAKDCIMNRNSFKCGKDYIDALERAIAKAEKSM